MVALTFEQVVEDHAKTMRDKYVKKVSRKCGDYAEDAVQQTYLKCLIFKESFHMGLKFDNWFKRILFTTVSDYRKFANGQPLVDIDENEVDPIEEMGYTSMVRGEIYKKIESIPQEEEQEVVSLHFQYGYKPQEIVALTDQSLRNINFWLNKFRKDIKDTYQ